MTAEERRKASGPAYRAAAAPAHRGAATVVRRSALRLPLWGAKTSWEAKTSPPVGSRQAFLKRERRPGCEAHRGNAVPRRHCRDCGGEGASLFDIVDRKIKTPVRDVGAL